MTKQTTVDGIQSLSLKEGVESTHGVFQVAEFLGQQEVGLIPSTQAITH
jgi:hypothetical protein